MDSSKEPVTNGTLQNVVREIREDIAQLATSVSGRFDRVDARLNSVDARFDSVDARFDTVTETMRDIETNLLTEFHRYAKGTSHRLHTLEITDSDVKERLHQIEERLLELERRIRPQ